MRRFTLQRRWKAHLVKCFVVVFVFLLFCSLLLLLRFRCSVIKTKQKFHRKEKKRKRFAFSAVLNNRAISADRHHQWQPCCSSTLILKTLLHRDTQSIFILFLLYAKIRFSYCYCSTIYCFNFTALPNALIITTQKQLSLVNFCYSNSHRVYPFFFLSSFVFTLATALLILMSYFILFGSQCQFYPLDNFECEIGSLFEYVFFLFSHIIISSSWWWWWWWLFVLIRLDG